MTKSVVTGSGKFEYKVMVNWEKLPSDHQWRDAAGIAVDSKDRVYVFNRGEYPIMVFDSHGNLLSQWGIGLFERAHGLTIGPDDTLYCTDDIGHTIRHYTPNGKLLMTIGEPGNPSPPHSCLPFNRCTDVALDRRNGDIYVSDGYLNSAVHKYSPDGKYLFSWGKPGTDPGEFNIVHNIATDKNGYVYVADRENHRIQIFDSDGNFEEQWVNMHRPSAVFVSDEHVYVGELGPEMTVNQAVTGIGPRISIYNTNGERLARLGDSTIGFEAGQFYAPHSICLDSKNNILLGEVDWTYSGVLGDSRDKLRGIQKLEKIV